MFWHHKTKPHSTVGLDCQKARFVDLLVAVLSANFVQSRDGFGGQMQCGSFQVFAQMINR